MNEEDNFNLIVAVLVAVLLFSFALMNVIEDKTLCHNAGHTLWQCIKWGVRWTCEGCS